MRKLFKTISLKFSLALLALVFSAKIFAQSPIARVTSVKGDAFVKMGDKLMPLKPGQNLFDSNTIMTTVGSQVSFSDFFDHLYQLAGEGQIQIRPQVIQLHRGYFWIQSLGKHQQIFQVISANAKLYYSNGHGVVSFDPYSGRTQFISVQGYFGFGNLLQPELDVKVSTGEFSFVDTEFQEGVPRYATAVGKQTFDQIVSLFPEITQEQKLAPEFQLLAKSDQGPSRAPASVAKESQSGSITFIPMKQELDKTRAEREKILASYKAPAASSGRAPASISSSKTASNVKVQVFGANTQVKKSATVNRAPASVQDMVQSARTPSALGAQTDVFEKGLQKQYQKQQPHSDEVNQLLRELKNYQMDLRSGF